MGRGNYRTRLRAAVALRNEWDAYQKAADDFKAWRKRSVANGYVEACIKLMVAKKSMNVLDERNDSTFKFPKTCITYDMSMGKQKEIFESKRNDVLRVTAKPSPFTLPLAGMNFGITEKVVEKLKRKLGMK